MNKYSHFFLRCDRSKYLHVGMSVGYVSGVFGCRVVILDQSLHGALLYGAELHAQALGSLLDFAAEGVGDRAYAVDTTNPLYIFAISIKT